MDDAPTRRPPPLIRNAALQALSEAARERVTAELECVTLSTGSVVFDNDAPGLYVIFPADCVLSLRGLLPDGGSSELALISGDGMVGLGALAGNSPIGGKVHMRWHAMRAGTAWRLPTRTLLDLIDASPAARSAVMACYNRLAWEFLVRAQCNRHHRLEEQLCGWLLRFRVLSGTDEIACTQQEIADVIGVRREGVTEALGRLQARGAVECGRGRLRILDATALAERDCGCQRVLDDRLSASITQPVATNTADKPAAFRKTLAYPSLVTSKNG
jgi:CRP-like cAMP-binding protein